MERDWRDFKTLYGNIEGARAAFEPACESLFRKMFPDQHVQVVRANPGDEGIDILVGEIGVEPIKVFQCKFFLEQLGNTQKGDIRKSFKTANESKEYDMAEWTLCIPKTLDIPEHKWWAGWKSRTQQKYVIPIHLKNGDELIDLMKEYGIYERVFQIDWELKTDSILEKTTSIETLLKQSITQETPLTNHAQQVKDWLTALGYAFEPEAIQEDSHLGWIARKGFECVFVLIVCDVVELPHVTLLRQYVETYRCLEGWIVTTLRISPQARQEIQNKGTQHMCCYTFDELLDKDADFAAYVEWLESQIKETGIDQQYIPLAFQKREFNPHTRKYEPYTYNEEYGWLEGYLDQWLDDSAKRHISILGEFGMGKTWSALHYAWRQLQHYQEAKRKGLPRPRLPLYIPLREYPIDRIETLFSKFFSRYQISLPNYAAFEQLNKFGKLLLIFDGFDEISNVVNPQEISRNFWELARASTEHSKIILTCRNEYFPNAKEARTLLNADLRESTAHLTGESPQFEILELVPFTEEQIRQALARDASSEVIEKIMDDEKLVDLARRPVLIELIVEALPDIEAGKPVDMARIYLYAISRKMQRDTSEKRTCTPLAAKLYFLCELSYTMSYYHPESLNHAWISALITLLFNKKLSDEQKIDLWCHDMLAQSVLIRDEEGNYTLAHQSFLDFFVAYKIGAELGILAPDFAEIMRAPSHSDEDLIPQVYPNIGFWYYKKKYSDIAPISCCIIKPEEHTVEVIPQFTLGLIHPWLHNAVLDLLYEMTPFHEEKIQQLLLHLLEASQKQQIGNVVYAASNIVMLFLRHQQDFFKGKKLSYLNLPGLRCWILRGNQVDFTGTSFQGSDLTDADLSDGILTNADLRDTILNDVEFKISELYVSLQHPHENFIVVESDSHLLLLDLETNSIVRKIQGGRAYSPILSPNKKHIIISLGTHFKIIDIETFCVVSERTIDIGDSEGIDTFIFGDSSDLLICADGGELKIHFWNMRENSILKTIDLEQEEWAGVNRIALSPNKQYLVAETTQTFQIWNIISDTLVHVELSQNSGFTTGIFHPQDNHLITSNNQTDVIRIVDVQTMSPIKEIPSEKGEHHLYFNDDGSILAAVHHEKITLYDYCSGQVISRCDIHNVDDYLYQRSEHSLNAHFRRRYSGRSFSINNVVFNNNGKFIHIAAEPGYLLTYEIQTGKLHNAFAYIETVAGADFTGSKGLKYELAQQLKGNGAIINPDEYK